MKKCVIVALQHGNLAIFHKLVFYLFNNGFPSRKERVYDLFLNNHRLH